ncbi:hypothetical protein [Paraburkholderia sp. BR14374]|uniref:hypothetical protein n=1 Tax=Paraburkholderia sp. BR14374 TaxID=3237007 RepID=UPI0034CD246E
MEDPGYFLASPIIKKIERPYSWCMTTDAGWCLYPDEGMLVVAPPDYPKLAEGLEIGDLYDYVSGPDGTAGGMYHLSSYLGDRYYFEWCEQLVSLVTKGKKLQRGPYRMVDWSVALSELVEDKNECPETEGRGPFWELLRYGLRGMTFGPVACRKLAADFAKWQEAASALEDTRFSQMYTHVRECFDLANGIGMVTYPSRWSEGGEEFREPKLGIETLELLEPPSEVTV